MSKVNFTDHCQEGQPIHESATYQAIKADIVRECVSRRIDTKQLQVTYDTDAFMADVILRMTLSLLETRGREEITRRIVVYPTWWEHFKASVFPQMWSWIGLSALADSVPVTYQFVNRCPHISIRNDEHIRFLGSILR